MNKQESAMPAADGAILQIFILMDNQVTDAAHATDKAP